MTTRKRAKITSSRRGGGGSIVTKIFKPGAEDAYLHAVETPPISDQLQAMVLQVQTALPNVLALTNKIAAVLDNAANATSNLNVALVETRPMITNFALVSAQLREPGGPLVWALGTNGNGQLQGALTNVNSLLVNVDTNLNQITEEIGRMLDQPRRHHQQLERAGAGEHEHVERNFQDSDGRGRFCSGFEAALAVALGVQERKCRGQDQRAAAGFAVAADARTVGQASRLSYVWLFLNHSANNLMPSSNFTRGL